MNLSGRKAWDGRCLVLVRVCAVNCDPESDTNNDQREDYALHEYMYIVSYGYVIELEERRTTS
jgi:hypothetical protein